MSAGGIAGSAGSGAAAGSMFGPWGTAIGAGVGLLSGVLGHSAEKENQRRTSMIRAAEQRASPWTKMAPTTEVDYAAPLAGKMLGGVTSGLSLAQGLENAAAPNAVAKVSPAVSSVADVAKAAPASFDIPVNEPMNFNANLMPDPAEVSARQQSVWSTMNSLGNEPKKPVLYSTNSTPWGR